MATTSTTTFFAAYTAFYGVIKTSLATLSDPWTVFDGDPRQGEFNYIAALLGPVEWVDSPAGIGAGSPSFPIDEEYRINARLAVWDETIDQSISRASIASAYEAIFAGVRADPTLGAVPGVLWSYLGAAEYEQGANDMGGSSAQIDIYLNVRARLH